MTVFLGFLLSFTAVFLILLVLVQRGRGGGLTGALGGMGGQSAFGAKAGDVFTKVTVVTAIIWVLLCVATVKVFNSGDDPLAEDVGSRKTPASGAPGILSTTPPAEAEPDSGEGANE